MYGNDSRIYRGCRISGGNAGGEIETPPTLKQQIGQLYQFIVGTLNKPIDEFYDMTMKEANLLAIQYEKDKLRFVNDVSFAVAYGISGALSKNGYKPLKANQAKKVSPQEKKETLQNLFSELGG